MDVVARAVHPNSICEGCLSRDRILAIITNDEIKKVYCTIIHEKLYATGPLVLCWECIANIQRHISFKRQCKNAHDTLVKYMRSPSNIKSLSRLSVVKNHVEIIYEESYEVNSTPKHETQNYKVKINTQKDEENPNFTVNVDRMNNGVNLTPQMAHKEETDITFIKVEGDDDDYYLGDESQHDADDKHIEAVIKSDTEEKTRKKIDIEFNDSDEEPLKNKKRNKTIRKTKHKKKKNDLAVDDKVKVKRKREKPAGVVNNSRVTKKLQQLNVEEGTLEMVVLSWEEVEEERQKALNSHVFTRHDYRCFDCILGFNHKIKLVNHMKKHDPSAGAFVCGVCQVRCRDSHALCAHKRRHRVRWRCARCGWLSSRAAVCADHAARAHGAAPPAHACARCPHTAATLGKLRNHIKSHAERQKCELCGKSFRDRTSLRTHLFIHKGEKEYSCPRCDKQFLFKKAMEVHLVTHDAPAHLYCYQCDLTFKNRMSYTQHIKYSLKHIDPAKLKYACHLCDKKFAKATRLEEHNLAVHLKATPITCTMPECNFACSSRPVLRTHIRMVHRNARALRNHVCDVCGKTYTTKKTLEGHMRSHTGERPFKCSLCLSTFGYEAALYNHNKLVHLKAKTCRRPQLPLQLQVPATPAD